MPEILIIDDDLQFNSALTDVVRENGYSVTSAYTMTSGLDILHNETFDVLLLDVQLPDGNGLDTIGKIRHLPDAPEIIIMTGYDNNMGAEFAVKNGAWDYIKKPLSIDDIALSLKRALQYRAQKSRRTSYLERSSIVGSGREITVALDNLAYAAQSDAAVLITGETGTGKELFAKTLHENSARSDKEFIIVDCASIPDNLVESILFGHKKGSFTGATEDKTGLIAAADGGTLFLDEIGELPLSVQKVFLRTLQEKKVKPLGGKKEIASNFRLVSATNRDLSEMVSDGGFREDLFYRINSYHIELPPLRNRISDIKNLLGQGIANYCERNGIEIKGYSPEFLEALTVYSWPGNIREFFNVLERTLAVAVYDPTLYPFHLPSQIRLSAISRKDSDRQNQTSLGGVSDSGFPTFREYKARMESHYLKNLLAETNGKRAEAVKKSGLSRSQFFNLLKKYGI